MAGRCDAGRRIEGRIAKLVVIVTAALVLLLHATYRKRRLSRVPETAAWRRTVDDEDIAEFAAIDGDEIMAGLGREHDADGNWSEEDMVLRWDECARRHPVAIHGSVSA